MKKSNSSPFQKFSGIDLPKRALIFGMLGTFAALMTASTVRAEESAATAFTVEPDTVGLWNFEEGDGDMLTDMDVSGIVFRQSEQSKGSVSWVDGKFGKAMHFPGGTSLNASTSAAPVDLTSGQMTVEVWINPDEESFGNEMAILQYGSHSQCGFRFAIQKNGLPLILLQNGSSEIGLSSDLPIFPGEWTHIAATYDGSTARIFVNGYLAGEKVVEGAIIQPESNAGVSLGYMGAQSHPYFVGDINALRISNTARTEFPSP